MRFAPSPMLASLLAIFVVSPVLGQPPATAKKGGEPRMVRAKDGWPIAITYYESPNGKESPVVILLHGDEGQGNRLVWDKFATSLQADGIAAVSVDLRKHGESLPPNLVQKRIVPADYAAMTQLDLGAVKKFVYEEHQAQRLNMRKIGIVGVDFSAPIAVNFALQDWMKRPYNDAPTLAASTPRGQDVRAIALVSPQDSIAGVQTVRELTALRTPAWNVAFMFANGARDKKDKGTTEKMYERLVKNADRATERMYHKEYPTAFRGTDLLGRNGVSLEAHMKQFFKLHLKDLGGNWVDRKPRI